MIAREYTVTYIAKEFLQRNGWQIIAYNPPGSQGTFTITNPEKDGGYRGQTGSLSPDIIALKTTPTKNIFLIVESKPKYEKSDVVKMKDMFGNPQRLEIFNKLILGYTSANEINYDSSLPNEIEYVNAYSGELSEVDGVNTILVNQKVSDWNLKNIDPTENIYDKFEVKSTKLFSEN